MLRGGDDSGVGVAAAPQAGRGALAGCEMPSRKARAGKGKPSLWRRQRRQRRRGSAGGDCVTGGSRRRQAGPRRRPRARGGWRRVVVLSSIGRAPNPYACPGGRPRRCAAVRPGGGSEGRAPCRHRRNRRAAFPPAPRLGASPAHAPSPAGRRWWRSAVWRWRRWSVPSRR